MSVLRPTVALTSMIYVAAMSQSEMTIDMTAEIERRIDESRKRLESLSKSYSPKVDDQT